MAINVKLVHGLSSSNVERAVLVQILFWHPKAKMVRDGHRWLVKTAQEFQDHGVVAAEKTIWKALANLRKRGLIETRRWPHPFRKDLAGPVTWVRPTDVLLAAVDPKGHSGLPHKGSQDCSTGALGTAPEGHSYITEDNTVESCSSSAEAAAETEKEVPMVKLPGDGAQKLGSKPKLSATQIAQGAQGMKPKVMSETAIPKASVLLDIFAFEYKLKFGVSPGASSPVRIAMFKKALERFREAGLSDLQVRALIHNAVNEWSGFATWAKDTLNLNVKAARANHSDITRLAFELADWFQTPTSLSQHDNAGGPHSDTQTDQNASSGVSDWLSGEF